MSHRQHLNRENREEENNRYETLHLRWDLLRKTVIVNKPQACVHMQLDVKKQPNNLGLISHCLLVSIVTTLPFSTRLNKSLSQTRKNVEKPH